MEAPPQRDLSLAMRWRPSPPRMATATATADRGDRGVSKGHPAATFMRYVIGGALVFKARGIQPRRACARMRYIHAHGVVCAYAWSCACTCTCRHAHARRPTHVPLRCTLKARACTCALHMSHVHCTCGVHRTIAPPVTRRLKRCSITSR